MFETRKCKHCNSDFIPQSHSQHYCSEECRVIQNRIRSRETKAQERLKRKRKKETSLKNVASAARKAGMSYGQYVAQMEMQKGG